ncbi:uncharacterized protein EI97DRAFT_432544, partial [Westerdykella ornata]
MADRAAKRLRRISSDSDDYNDGADVKDISYQSRYVADTRPFTLVAKYDPLYKRLQAFANNRAAIDTRTPFTSPLPYNLCHTVAILPPFLDSRLLHPCLL